MTKSHPVDTDASHGGKVANDHNKTDTQDTPTQKNEPQRTPESRHDRESRLGSHNQNRSRSTGGGKGNGGGGGGAG